MSGPPTVSVNGAAYQLGDPSQSLASFLRENVGDKGCKVSCASGSCGSCAVVCSFLDGAAGGVATRSINACLAPVGSLAGCAITTASGLGNSRDGFHPIQERIGAFHASQCGFCTPGIVAACHAAAQKKQQAAATGAAGGSGAHDGAAGKGGLAIGGSHRGAGADGTLEGGEEGEGAGPILADVEHALDGNLCRCTGYRPVLDALKSLTPGVDIEDLGLHTLLPNGAAGSSPRCPPAPQVTEPPAALRSGGKLWLAPATLEELRRLLQQYSGDAGKPPRVLAGNTGSGLFHSCWPAEEVVLSVLRVKEMRGISQEGGVLRVGAATTISELSEKLGRLGITQEGDGSSRSSSPLAALSALLQRVAGTHVRNSATVGGNLVLARTKGLESDITTALAAWGATLHLLAASGKTSERGVLEFVGQAAGARVDAGAIITHLTMPLPAAEDYLWCHKVAPTYSNSHALINMAIKLSLSSSPPTNASTPATPVGGGAVVAATVVLGYPGPSGWTCHRAPGAEAALLGIELSMHSMANAIQAVAADLAPAEHIRRYCVGTAQGMVLQALAPLLRGGEGYLPPAAARLLQVSGQGLPTGLRSKQVFEAASPEMAPVGEPLEKDRVLLQASGEALFTGDIDMPAGALYAAYVTSTQGSAAIDSIDPSAALAMPGAVAFLSADDLAPGPRSLVKGMGPPEEPIFAQGRVLYYGQPVGLVVAQTRGAAMAAAKAVQVTYSDIQAPIVTIPGAIEANSYYAAGPWMAGGDAPVSTGDVETAIAGAERRISGGRLDIPSQYHFYMETQTAMCVPDEGGSIRVHSSAQFLEGVQRAVAHTLGLRQHDVHVSCRRVGGGFGGKASRNVPVALACAVAANKLRKPVQLVLDRQTDMALVGGRMETSVSYDVGFTKDGIIQGVDIRAWLLRGAYPDASFDQVLVKMTTDMCYAIPNFRIEVKTCKANLPPHTSVRAPGKFQATLIMEHILDHVAAHCGLPAAEVRERNFARPPPPDQVSWKTPLNHTMSAADYTLPHVWERLKKSCGYEERAGRVRAFNAANPWVKRGIAMTHCRFDAHVPSKPAAVSIFQDGSVLVHAAGAELGQGLTTKVKQVAILELSQLLPESRRPLPADLVRLGDNSTCVLPAGFGTFGSTASEAACGGVQAACQELVERLRPFAEKLGEECTWESVLGAAAKAGGMFDANRVLLASVSNYVSSKGPYSVYGAACTEAEINVLTGERALLRTDIVMDSGRSINPAIDVGQVEGAFVQGLGLCMSEAVRRDSATGRLLSDSLWHYTIPTASSIPRELNVEFLAGTRNAKGVLSSKAMGEPPLLLSASALSAIQAAVAAARQEVHGLGALQQAQQAVTSACCTVEGVGIEALGIMPCLPATMECVKEAVGAFDLAGQLRAAFKTA